MPIENFGNSHGGGFFNFAIGIDKWQVQGFGKTQAEAGFPRSHHADKHNRTGANCRVIFDLNHMSAFSALISSLPLQVRGNCC
ncbi:MAG: Uncharacterised protein [Alphaproteobacteria bacterium]|nr:MAG: Uncharacterised protein [Alphaproteobacteria bacterium]